MLCRNCKKKMIYKPNVKGIQLYEKMYSSGCKTCDCNAYEVYYKEKRRDSQGEREVLLSKSISPEVYICPCCGLIQQKIPKEELNFILESSIDVSI